MNFDLWRHYLRARLFEMLGKDQRAAAEYQQALQHNPRFARAASGLGYLDARQERYHEAARWFQTSLDIDPNNANVQFNLGFIHDKHGQREEAIAAFREAVRLNPKLDRAWFGLGLANAALGRHAEAVAAFQEAAALQPMNAHAWYCLGMAHHHSHDPDKVKEVIEHLFRFDPVMTRQLIRDAERSDLAHLVHDLKV